MKFQNKSVISTFGFEQSETESTQVSTYRILSSFDILFFTVLLILALYNSYMFGFKEKRFKTFYVLMFYATAFFLIIFRLVGYIA